MKGYFFDRSYLIVPKKVGRTSQFFEGNIYHYKETNSFMRKKSKFLQAVSQ